MDSKKKFIKILEEGRGELLAWSDPDQVRKWVLENKTRALIDKRMTLEEAIAKFVHDGDYLVSGGFGHVRVSMAAIYEIVRQKKRELVIGGKTAVHDSDILIGAGCVDKIEVAYSFGHELRGLSPASRRAVEEGQVKVAAENSNAGLQWRWLAGMMGIPFMPSRVLLGTDTFQKSSSKIIADPWSGKPICLIPAANPDVAIIHVHLADIYGNAQIEGTLIEDFELARASRRVILTCEKIVDSEKIRKKPWQTIIPYFVVDAIIETPYGSHPCQMPGLYYFDEEHISEWLTLSQTPEGTNKYFEKYVFGARNFDEYLTLVGGVKKLRKLKRIELLKERAEYPWLSKKQKAFSFAKATEDKGGR